MKRMFWVLIVCAAQVISVEIRDEMIDDTTKECLKELSIDKETFASIFNETLYIKYPHEVTSKLFGCCLGKFSFFNKDGELIREFIIEHISKRLPLLLKDEIDEKKAVEITTTIYNSCQILKGEDLIEKLINFHNCLMTEMHRIALANVISLNYY